VGGIIVPEPDKPKRQGRGGVYDAPRELLESMPGIELTEMDRIREYSWCCGAGGGVMEGDPEFARSTALERIREARSTGAEAIVTSCPWCVRNLRDAQEGSDETIEVFDVMELLEKSL
jgi:Fe-S oxidoreductase